MNLAPSDLAGGDKTYPVSQPAACGCTAFSVDNTATLTDAATSTLLDDATASVTVPTCAADPSPPTATSSPGGLACAATVNWCARARAGRALLKGARRADAASVHQRRRPTHPRRAPAQTARARRGITKTAAETAVNFFVPQPARSALRTSPKPVRPNDYMVEYTLGVTAAATYTCSAPSAAVTFTAADNCGAATSITPGALSAGCSYGAGCTLVRGGGGRAPLPTRACLGWRARAAAAVAQALPLARSRRQPPRRTPQGVAFNLASSASRVCPISCTFSTSPPPGSVSAAYTYDTGAGPVAVSVPVTLNWAAAATTYSPSQCVLVTDTMVDTDFAGTPINSPTPSVCLQPGAPSLQQDITYDAVITPDFCNAPTSRTGVRGLGVKRACVDGRAVRACWLWRGARARAAAPASAGRRRRR